MIVQPSFYVPPEIAEGILKGDFIRFGGVVRDTAGRLVIHLKEVPGQEKAIEKLSKYAASNLKNPWLITGVTITLATVAGAVFLASRKESKESENESEYVENYNQSLAAYVKALQSGRLNADIIDRVIKDLDSVTAYDSENDKYVTLSPEQLAPVVELVLCYTLELAKANDFELDQVRASSGTSSDAMVVDLRRYLETQKEIFRKAA